MAVINCPSCNKKISDKAKQCPHCGLDIANLDDEKLSSIAHVNTIKKSQTMMTHSFIAMLLFCGGFLFMWWSNPAPDTWQYITATSMTVIGFIFYIVTRVRIIILKRRSKKWI